MSPLGNTAAKLFADRRILITCGTGGVGKTTLSAALAIKAAILGKRVVVVTIDPAKRLAHALGIHDLVDHPTDITETVQRALTQVDGAKVAGKISALMPDTRRTFEGFIQGLMPDPTQAKRVLENPIFQIFAREFSGTNEYMALQKLYALEQSGEFDLIILDTPPSRNTLAFLEAPGLLSRLFEERIIHMLAAPAGRLGAATKIAASGMRKALSMLEKLTGQGFMTSLFDFASSIFEVRVGFAANLKRITELLRSPSVGFVLVSAPHPGRVEEIGHFVAKLAEQGHFFDGVLLNRSLSELEKASPAAVESATPGMREALERLATARQSEAAAIREIERNSWPIHAKLPELARDVHSVEDLIHVALAL